MKHKESFVQRFMRITGKTSAILGPANRSDIEHHGKHRKLSAEEVERHERADKEWEVIKTESGRQYLIDKNPTDATEPDSTPS